MHGVFERPDVTRVARDWAEVAEEEFMKEKNLEYPKIKEIKKSRKKSGTGIQNIIREEIRQGTLKNPNLR